MTTVRSNFVPGTTPAPPAFVVVLADDDFDGVIFSHHILRVCILCRQLVCDRAEYHVGLRVMDAHRAHVCVFFVYADCVSGMHYGLQLYIHMNKCAHTVGSMNLRLGDLGQYELGGVFARLHAGAPQFADLFAQLRAIFGLANVYQ